MTRTEITKELSKFLVGDDLSLSEDASRRAKVLILDSLAVMIGGSATSTSQILRQYIEDENSEGPSTVVGTSLTTSAARAALLNGTSGHAQDYDDTVLFTTNAAVFGNRMHPSVPTLAAALALAEKQHSTGEELLAAFAYGYEAACRIADSGSREMYRRGYHPTGVVGPFGAAVASARILGVVDQSQMQNVLGMVGSLGAGLRENYGTMMKPFHAGRAAESGVLAASLVKRGFTATNRLLEGERGFFAAFSGDFSVSQLLDSLGNPYYLERPGSAVKPYPTGSLSHPTLDATFKIIEDHELTAEEVVHVHVGTNSNIGGSLIHSDARDALQAKFSIPALVSLAFILRKISTHDLSNRTIERDDVRAFMTRVQVEVVDEIESLGYDQPRARVTVLTKDGREFSERVDAAQGTFENPMTESALRKKIESCVAEVFPSERVEQIYEVVFSLDKQNSLDELFGLMKQ